MTGKLKRCAARSLNLLRGNKSGRAFPLGIKVKNRRDPTAAGMPSYFNFEDDNLE